MPGSTSKITHYQDGYDEKMVLRPEERDPSLPWPRCSVHADCDCTLPGCVVRHATVWDVLNILGLRIWEIITFCLLLHIVLHVFIFPQ